MSSDERRDEAWMAGFRQQGWSSSSSEEVSAHVAGKVAHDAIHQTNTSGWFPLHDKEPESWSSTIWPPSPSGAGATHYVGSKELRSSSRSLHYVADTTGSSSWDRSNAGWIILFVLLTLLGSIVFIGENGVGGVPGLLLALCVALFGVLMLRRLITTLTRWIDP